MHTNVYATFIQYIKILFKLKKKKKCDLPYLDREYIKFKSI